MKIGICEDDGILREEVRVLVEKYYQQYGVEIEIFEYGSGEELIASHNKEEMFLLDISMDQLDGIQTAEKLRNLGSNSIIIFLTSHKERVFEAFKVQAFQYLIKPVAELELYKVLDDAMTSLKKEEKKFLTINIKQKIIKLLYNEIFYVESIGKNIEIHTTDKSYTTREKISSLEKKLQGNGFFRIHKSYLVNLEHVKQIDSDTAILGNDDHVYISRLRHKAFKEAFIEYLKGNKKVWH